MSASHDSHGHGGSRFIQHHYDDAQHQFDSGKLGIWIFLAQEVLFFSGLFVAYVLYRVHHPEIFSYAHKYLQVKFGAINTAVLIFSSLTAAWAVRCAQRNERKGLILCIVVTILCACGFLTIKYMEYSHKIHEHILFGRYFDPCVSSGGEKLLTKNNECEGSKSAVVWDKGTAKPASGCMDMASIDQNPADLAVQADCAVREDRAVEGGNKIRDYMGDGPFWSTVATVKTAATDKGDVKGAAILASVKPPAPLAADASEAEKRMFEEKKRLFDEISALGGATVAKVTDISSICPVQIPGNEGEESDTKHEPGKEIEPVAPKYPCWQISYQPAVCTADQGKPRVGVIVRYGDEDERGEDYHIESTCKPAPKVVAPIDPLADKVQTITLGKATISRAHQMTDHELREHELEMQISGPPPDHTSMFLTIYFAMTGLHGIHVAIGIGVFIWLLFRSIRGDFTPDYYGPIDFAALYWHIVDLIWIFLFPLLYLIH